MDQISHIKAQNVGGETDALRILNVGSSPVFFCLLYPIVFFVFFSNSRMYFYLDVP